MLFYISFIFARSHTHDTLKGIIVGTVLPQATVAYNNRFTSTSMISIRDPCLKNNNRNTQAVPSHALLLFNFLFLFHCFIPFRCKGSSASSFSESWTSQSSANVLSMIIDISQAHSVKSLLVSGMLFCRPASRQVHLVPDVVLLFSCTCFPIFLWNFFSKTLH